MNPIDIIAEFYDRDSTTYELLVQHGRQVAQKALDIATKMPHINLDRKFIKEAAVLHDIGVFMTNSPEIGCHGGYPYVCHGYLGRELLDNKGLPKHALVCERHVGVGITAEEIRRNQLPLPERDMVPVSIEEKIICYADKFFTKNGRKLETERPINEILRKIAPYGKDKVVTFQSWLALFGSK